MLTLSILCLIPALAIAGVLEGTAIHVADGDTITVLDPSKKRNRVRIAGIDAPEKGHTQLNPIERKRNGFILVGQSRNGDRRETPINDAVRKVLTGIVRRIDSPHVFCKENGRVFKGGRNAFERACKRAGVCKFRFHDLRHAAASLMAMAGYDLMAIKQVLGHKTIQMTLRYSHLSPGHLRNAVAAIDRAMMPPSNPTSPFTSQSGDFPAPGIEATTVTARF